MKIKLTASDYYRANQPEFVRKYPEIARALVRIQKNCKPSCCETCYFFHVVYDPDKFSAECSIGDVKYQYGKRADGCPLDTGVFTFDEKLSEETDTGIGEFTGGRECERETGSKTGGETH